MQSTQTSRVGDRAESLPDCDFIQSNLPAARPGLATTTTKAGRAEMTKKARKNPTLEKKKQPAAGRKKQLAAGRKKQTAAGTKD